MMKFTIVQCIKLKTDADLGLGQVDLMAGVEYLHRLDFCRMPLPLQPALGKIPL